MVLQLHGCVICHMKERHLTLIFTCLSSSKTVKMECIEDKLGDTITHQCQETLKESTGDTANDTDSSDNHLPMSTKDKASADGVVLSKRKRKKLEQQMKKKEYLKEKRQLERQRKKQRLREAKAQGTYTGPSRKALKLNTMAKSQCKIQVVVDCAFDDLMTEKDIKSVVKQINFCYASNRRAEEPLQFYITSFNKRLKKAMEAIGDYSKWDVHLEESSFDEIFPKDKIVYLTSDSSNILESLSEDKVYIIGGLVDHNHHKGVCLKLAEEKGFAHAQLPIGDYIMLESRKVLAVNHVFDILLRYTENSDWKEAFYKVIPQRKILSPKDLVSSAKPISEQSDGQVVQHDNDTSVGSYNTASKTQNIKSAFDGKSSSSEDQ